MISTELEQEQKRGKVSKELKEGRKKLITRLKRDVERVESQAAQ